MERIEKEYKKEREGFENVFKFVTILMIFMLIVFIPWSPYSGMLRWTISIFSLGIIASIVALLMYRRSQPLESWKRKNELNMQVGSKLGETSELVQRAFKGYDASQALLEERLKDHIIESLKQDRGLSPDEIDELMNDMEKLKKEIGDEDIYEFLKTSKDFRDAGGAARLFSDRARESPQDYKKRIERVMDKMEELG